MLFLIPAAVFTGLEPHWNYLDSMYYCFISLTTVGLGDFIPGDTPGQHLRPLYKACTTCECNFETNLSSHAGFFPNKHNLFTRVVGPTQKVSSNIKK